MSDAAPSFVDEDPAPGTARDWREWARGELAAHSTDHLGEATTDAETLLAAALNVERAALRARLADGLDRATALRFVGWIERRKLGEPVAYILGRVGFWTLDLAVDTAVLISRPDTETLVHWALELLPVEAPCRVLDLGTGSGAIALAIAQERPRAIVVATDISADALAVARENAQRNGVANVRFREGGWFAALTDDETDGFDLIVSNPPYVAEGDAHLDALRYEPRLALTSGVDGLDAIRQIVGQAREHLRCDGALLLEHGADQAPAVRALLAAAGLVDIATRRDYGGHERVTGAIAP